MDWGGKLEFALVSIAKGQKTNSYAPGDYLDHIKFDRTSVPAGLKWTSKYDMVGTQEVHGLLADGLNTEGLSCAMLYLPKYTKYMPVDKVKTEKAIIAPDVCRWALQTLSSVSEVKTEIMKVDIWAPEFGSPELDAGTHYAFLDKTGESIVVEWLEGETKIFKNPEGVMTNAPPFPFHEMSMKDYGNLKPDTAEDSNSQGSGMTGLPGSFTSTDRFIRLRKLKEYMKKPENAEEAVTQVHDLLGETNVLLGTTRDKKASGDGYLYDVTEWSSIMDTTNSVYYYRHRKNPNLNAIDLKKVSFKDVMTFPLFKETSNIYDASKEWEK